MDFYSKGQARQLMNQWGTEGKDFLFIIDYKQQNCVVCLLEEINPKEILYAFPSSRNDTEIVPSEVNEVDWEVFPETSQCYRKKFAIVQHHLHEGNSFLVNLTCRIPVRTRLSLLDMYTHSSALYKLWIRNHFVCFSPEIFVRIDRKGQIHSYPMKGTISAEVPEAEKVLMTNSKESAEHATIVDLIRNDISMVASQVHVERYRYIDVLQTNLGRILQTSSEITGSLPDDFMNRLGDIIFTQLPAGSITGAPKFKTQEIISEAEDYERGFYTGVMGIFKNQELDSAVMIRFVEESEEVLDKEGKHQYFFKAGGGITAQSNWKDEYEEVIQKAYVPIR